jgi:hypothetical protein
VRRRSSRRTPPRSRRTFGESLPNGFHFLSGDVNFRDYGGKWIKADGSDYYIIELLAQTEYGWDPEDGKYLVILTAIDVANASPDIVRRALDTAGWASDIPIDEFMIAEALSEYGAGDIIWNTFTNNYREALTAATRRV